MRRGAADLGREPRGLGAKKRPIRHAKGAGAPSGRADPIKPFVRTEAFDYCAGGAAGAGVSGAGAGAGAGAGVSAAGAGASPPDFPSTQLINVPSYLQWCRWACTTTRTAAITIKIRRIRIQTPSLFPRRNVYEWKQNQKGRCEAGPNGFVAGILTQNRVPNVLFARLLAAGEVSPAAPSPSSLVV